MNTESPSHNLTKEILYPPILLFLYHCDLCERKHNYHPLHRFRIRVITGIPVIYNRPRGITVSIPDIAFQIKPWVSRWFLTDIVTSSIVRPVTQVKLLVRSNFIPMKEKRVDRHADGRNTICIEQLVCSKICVSLIGYPVRKICAVRSIIGAENAIKIFSKSYYVCIVADRISSTISAVLIRHISKQQISRCGSKAVTAHFKMRPPTVTRAGVAELLIKQPYLSMRADSNSAICSCSDRSEIAAPCLASISRSSNVDSVSCSRRAIAPGEVNCLTVPRINSNGHLTSDTLSAEESAQRNNLHSRSHNLPGQSITAVK